MSIENDIHQTKFNSEYHKMSVNLIYTYNWAMEKAKRFFEKADLTMQQYNILRILRGAGKPLSTLQIRQRMLDKMSDTSRIVDRLVIKELATKKPSLTDKRLVDIAITSRGIAMLERLDRKNEEMDSLLQALSEREVKILNQLLDKIRKSD